MINNKPSPPKLFLRFFRWYCNPKLVNHIEGDLMELYRERVRALGKRKADAKFILDVMLLCRAGIIRPVRIYRNLNPYGMYKSYFKVASRNIIKQKAYNILNVVGLAVGIASGLIIATHSREELSYEKSFEGYENIYRVHREGWAASSPVMAAEFREFFPDIEAIGRFSPYGTRVVTTDNNNPGEVTGFYADSTILNVFGFKVSEGDPHPLAALNTAAITQQMASRYFGEENPIGKILRFDNQQEFTVTAVMEDPPANSHLKFDCLLSMPNFYKDRREDADLSRGWMIMYTYARLKPGMLATLSEQMPQFIRKYYAGESDVEEKVASMAWQLMPLKDIHLRSNLEKEMAPNSSIVYIYIFVAVELLILIVASANFMSLFTTQAIRRVREVGMRKILGAKPLQLMLQFFAEVLLLVIVAAVLAVLLYQGALPFYNELSGRTLGPSQIFEPANLITTGIILFAVIVISGLYPAFFIAGFKAGSFLRESRLPGSMPNAVRNGMVVFQFVVSVSLIAAAIVVKQQMNLMKNKDLGFEKDQVISVKLYGQLWWKAYSEADVFKNDFLKNPDILAVGRTDRLIGERISIETVAPEHKDPERDKIPDVRVLRVDEGYVDAMDIQILEGRNFSREFNDSSSFIINESAARVLGLTFPVNEIVINHSNGPRKGKIVGVVKDYHYASLHAEIEPLVIEYEPGGTDQLVMKIRAGKNKETIEYIGKTIERLAPNSLFSYQFLDDRVNALYKSEDTMGKVFRFFSVLAIVIACLGLFGLSAYTIESRIKEIGIRKVLGANLSAIVALLSSRFIRLVLISFVLAIPITAYAMDKWLSNFAYKVGLEWWVFAFSGMAVMLIAILVTGFHAFRAATANPVNSLRSE
jgi:putative ABC transport system permease protein